MVMTFAELLLRTREYMQETTLAGFGPISDGIPEAIGDGGSSETRMPAAPRVSRALIDYDKTAPTRKATP